MSLTKIDEKVRITGVLTNREYRQYLFEQNDLRFSLIEWHYNLFISQLLLLLGCIPKRRLRDLCFLFTIFIWKSQWRAGCQNVVSSIDCLHGLQEVPCWCFLFLTVGWLCKASRAFSNRALVFYLSHQFHLWIKNYLCGLRNLNSPTNLKETSTARWLSLCLTAYVRSFYF